MVSGGLDYLLKIWDFPGMNRKLKSMREYKPFEGHPINALSFDPDGANFLCCTTNNQARVYDKDGGKVQMTIRGDMYIQDMSNTKGHVAAITDGCWHPRESHLFLTASLDGSLRVWDLESKTVGIDQQLMHTQLIKAFSTKGMKLPVTSARYSGTLVAAGCSDGSVQVWDTRIKTLHRPAVHLREAHQPGEVTCIKLFKDEKRLATRAMDDTLKLWDVRNTRHAMQEWKELTNLSSKTAVALSPDERLLITGTSVRRGFGHGLLMAFDVATGETVCASPVSSDSVVAIQWHPVLNQVVVGSGDGSIRVLYDPARSQRGVTTSITKLEKRRPVDQGLVFSKPILTPSIYEDEREKEMEKDPFNPNNQNMPSSVIPPEVLNPALAKEKIREDPLLSKKPEQPLQGPQGRGGRISTSGTYT
jgi:WD40 repeat protein